MLDISGGVGGRDLIAWSAHGGLNQKWKLVPVEACQQQQPSIIQSLGVHKCIDVAGGCDGKNVIVYPIHKQDNQQ